MKSHLDWSSDQVLPLHPQQLSVVSNLDSRHLMQFYCIIVLSFPGEFLSTTLICPQNSRIQGMTVTLDVISQETLTLDILNANFQTETDTGENTL
jgi:hypothetical protein